MSGQPVPAFRARAAMGIGQAVACELVGSFHSLIQQDPSGPPGSFGGSNWLSTVAAHLGLAPPRSVAGHYASRNESDALLCLGSGTHQQIKGGSSESASAVYSQEEGVVSRRSGFLADNGASTTLPSPGPSTEEGDLGPSDFVVAIATHHARHHILRATVEARKVRSRTCVVFADCDNSEALKCVASNYVEYRLSTRACTLVR